MADQMLLMVGTVKGAFFYHSDASRRDWTMTGPHLPGWEVYSLCGHNGNGNGGRIYAGTSHWVYGPTVRMTEDMGESWREMKGSPRYPDGSDFKLQRIWQLELGHPSRPGRLYAGVEDAGLFLSEDEGETWSELSGLTSHPTRPHWFPGGGGLCLHTILVHPQNPDRIWVAISAVGAFRSDDGGVSWQVCNRGLPQVATGQDENAVARCVHKIALDPEDPDRLYMQFHGGVFRSMDGGDSWTSMEDGLPSNFGFPLCVTRSGALFLVPLQSDEQRFAKDGKLRVYRSRDRGDSWEPLSTGLSDEPQFVGVLRDAMCVDPLDPAGVYFGTTMGEVFYSADEGDHWQKLPGQLPRITSMRTWVR